MHLYEEYGDELVHAIEGMFAVAVWDEKRGRLLLGRDRFGQKPVFLYRRGGCLMFASEISALVRPLEFRPDVDLNAVDLFMVLVYVPGPGTILQGIEQLLPGSVLTWDHASDAVETHAYWAPSRSVQATRR